MKLTYLLPTRFPTERANGTQVAKMCNAFAYQSLLVTLVVPKREDEVKTDAFAYYDIKENFKIHKMYCLPWGVGSKFGFYTNILAYSVRSFFYVLFSPSEVIYSRNEFVLLSQLFFRRKSILVYESHEAKFNFAVRWLFKSGVKCVAISEGIKELYVVQGIPESQILVAHDGIDESFFGQVESKEQARVRLGIVSDKPVVMYIGHFDRWKGVETFFKASRSCTDVKFVAIGGRKDEIKQYEKEYPEVQFLGARPYNELKNNQQAADVLVIPNTAKNNLSAQYTSPLKLFAHLTSRIPMVVSDIPSIRNIVSEDEVWFFKPDDPEALVATIERAIGAPELERKCLSAFELSKQYTWEHRAKEIFAFIGSKSS